MSNYRLEDDFIRRTRMNLEFIRKHQKDHPDEVFEVTQFINSLLGLLVYPKEHLIKKIPNSTIEILESQGWNLPVIVGWRSDEERNLYQLIRHLRNSVSHVTFDFSTRNSEIEKISFQDMSGFKVIFDLISLESFIFRFVNELENVLQNHER